MAKREQATCSSCGRQIIWTISPAGARLPLDARPVTAYWLREPFAGAVPEAVALNTRPVRATAVDQVFGEDHGPTKIYISHFLTCPQAREHSRGTRP